MCTACPIHLILHDLITTEHIKRYVNHDVAENDGMEKDMPVNINILGCPFILPKPVKYM
jgi:hypothetical protein